MKLRGQGIGAPSATQMGDQGQRTTEDDQADEAAQANFQHGLAVAPP
jgi:hypothetical protein